MALQGKEVSERLARDRKSVFQGKEYKNRRKRNTAHARTYASSLEVFNHQDPAIRERSDAFMVAYRAGPEAVRAWHEKYDRRT